MQREEQRARAPAAAAGPRRHRSGSLGPGGPAPPAGAQAGPGPPHHGHQQHHGAQSSLPKTIPRPRHALRRAKASARTATQRMRGMAKSNSKTKLAKTRCAGDGGAAHTGGLGVGHITMSGFMYKRRSGMTGLAASLLHQAESWTERKLGGRLWVLRYFVLRNGIIHYYDAPKRMRDADPGSDEFWEGLNEDFTPEPDSERGSIDLLRYGVQLRVFYGHGASSNTGASISAAERAKSPPSSIPNPGALAVPAFINPVSELAQSSGDLDHDSDSLGPEDTVTDIPDTSVSPPPLVISQQKAPPPQPQQQQQQQPPPPLRRNGRSASTNTPRVVASTSGRSSPAEGAAAQRAEAGSPGPSTESAGSTLPHHASSASAGAGSNSSAAVAAAVAEPTSPSGASSSANDTKSPSPYHIEIAYNAYNNVLNPKEWQSWTLCTTDRSAHFRWLTALTAVIYVDRSLPAPEEEDDDDIDDVDHEPNFAFGGLVDLHAQGSPILATDAEDDYYVGEIAPDELYADIEEDQNLFAQRMPPLETQGALYPPGPAEAQRPAGTGLVGSLLTTVRENQLELAMALCFSNLLLLSVYELKPVIAIFVLTIVNLLVIWRLQGPKGGGLERARPLSRKRKAPTVLVPQASGRRLASNRRRATVPHAGFSSRDLAAEGSAETSGAGAAARIVPHPVMHHSNLSGKLQGGTTLPFAEREEVLKGGPTHVWTHADDSVLKMRTGPNYKANKSKAPTKPSLFRTVGVDMLSSDKKIMELLDKLNAPMDLCVGPDAVPKGFPRLVVFNFQLPLPSISSLVSSDGKGYNFAIYLTPTEDLLSALDAMQKGEQVEPAIELLDRWFRTAETDVSLKERLKLVGYILNPIECGMPNWTQSFNGKPVLIKKSGVIFRDADVFEVDMDLRQWGILARKGVSALLPSALEKMEFIVSFVIQGEEDDELPERSMCATQFSYLDYKRAVKFSSA